MIQASFFIAVFCIIPVLWAGLILKSQVRLLTISIPSALIWAIFISQYIGYPILFFHLNEYRANYIQDQSIIWQMFLWSSYSVFMILFGFAFAIRSKLAFDLFECVEAARIPKTRFLPGFNNRAGA